MVAQNRAKFCQKHLIIQKFLLTIAQPGNNVYHLLGALLLLRSQPNQIHRKLFIRIHRMLLNRQPMLLQLDEIPTEKRMLFYLTIQDYKIRDVHKMINYLVVFACFQ